MIPSLPNLQTRPVSPGRGDPARQNRAPDAQLLQDASATRHVMMIATVAAAHAQPTSAHLSDRRFLPLQGTSPPTGPGVAFSTRPSHLPGHHWAHQHSSARPFRLAPPDHWGHRTNRIRFKTHSVGLCDIGSFRLGLPCSCSPAFGDPKSTSLCRVGSRRRTVLTALQM